MLIRESSQEPSFTPQEVTFSYYKSISERYGEGVAKLCHKVLYYCFLNEKKGKGLNVYLSARKLATCLDKSQRTIRRYFEVARRGGLVTTEKYYKDGFLLGNLVTPTEKLLTYLIGQGVREIRTFCPKGSDKMSGGLGQNDIPIYRKDIYNINTVSMHDTPAARSTVANATGMSDAQNEMRKIIQKQAEAIQILQEKLRAFESALASFHNINSPSQSKTPPEPQKTPLHLDTPQTENRGKAKEEAQLLEEKKFDEWYQLYPRKVSKKKAREAFGKALKKIPCEDLMALTKAYMNANETQETLKRENGKFIPHPTTWLNQERWEDYKESFQRRSSMTLAQVTTTATSEEDRKILESLYKRVGANTFASWFTYNDFHFLGLDHTPAGEVAIFEVKTAFSRDWIKSRFTQDIASSVKDVYGDALSIEVVLKGQRKLNPWKTQVGFLFVPQTKRIGM